MYITNNKHLVICLCCCILTIATQSFVASAAETVSTALNKQAAQQYIDNTLKTNQQMQNAIIGIYATNSKGERVAFLNNKYPMLPASTFKLITTGTALSILGKDYKYKTSISINGTIQDSTLIGNLSIIGGGDPTFGSKDTIAYSIDSLFGVWTTALKARGIKKIIGNIIADDSFFNRETIPDTWTWDDLGWYYGSAPSGLSFMENSLHAIALPGKNKGDSVSLNVIYPEHPFLKIVNNATTGAYRSGDKLSFYTSDLSGNSELNGTLGIDKGCTECFLSNKYPHISAAYEFLKFLRNNDIDVFLPPDSYYTAKSLSIVKDIREMPKNYAVGSDTISTVYSPNITKIINVTNRTSNNLYAETLFKTIGKVMTGTGSMDSSAVAVTRFLKAKGINTSGLRVEDGSGLSRLNYISAKTLTEFLALMQREKCFGEFFNSLPQPGKSGTLRYVLKAEQYSSGKNRIHAKSGSLTGVKSYAGYIESKSNGLIRFAVMFNNYPCETSQVQPFIESLLFELTK